MSKEKTERYFVGPAQTSWWKFKLAGIVWGLTREKLPFITKIPGMNRLTLWAFRVRVMSRDFEQIDGKNNE